MRQDQLKRLGELSEKLADVVLEEADPEVWPGAGKLLADISKVERGDRYWCKKNAAATLSLLMRVEQVRADQRDIGGRDQREDEEIDSEIAKAEKEAAKLLDKVGKAAKRGKFVKAAAGNGKA